MSEFDEKPEKQESLGGDPAGRNKRWIVIGILVAATFVTLPHVYRPLGPPGIDPGWQWAVNYAQQEGWIFGKDIVFTYGPLAFLMVPLDAGHNLVVANVFYMIVQALFAAALVAISSKTGKPVPTALFAVFYVCACHQGLSIEARLLIILGSLALVSVIDGSRLPLVVSSALAGVLFLVKMSLGIAGVAILAIAVVTSVLVYRRSSSFALGTLGFPTTVGVLAVFLFDHPTSFFHWVSLSLEVVSGYSVANSILGPKSQVAFGALAVVGWIAAALWVRSDRALLACNLLFAPVVLVQFRLAFVRQDTHQLQFVPFMLAIVAISTLLARRRRQILCHAMAFVLLLVGGTGTHLIDPLDRGLLPKTLVTGGSGTQAVLKLVHLRETREELTAASIDNLAALRLPEEWLDLVQSSTNGVGTMPWEIQYIPANDLSWNPTPTLQFYSACTRRLDAWSARRYSGPEAPEFILNQYVPVGKRHQMIDVPATWREIFIRYRMRSFFIQPDQIALLEVRPEIPITSYEEVSREAYVLGSAGLEVPDSQHLLFAEFDLRLNLLGRLQKTVFRVPLIYLVMHRLSGEVTYYRLTPEPAVHGVLINRFPKDFMGYRRLWQGVVDDPVVRITIAGDGMSFFRSPVEITWRELKIGAPTRSSSPSPGQD